jgi:hypothetical protein
MHLETAVLTQHGVQELTSKLANLIKVLKTGNIKN